MPIQLTLPVKATGLTEKEINKILSSLEGDNEEDKKEPEEEIGEKREKEELDVGRKKDFKEIVEKKDTNRLEENHKIFVEQ